MYSCRILSIPNSRGDKMLGVLEDTGSDHIVILCHGFQSSKEDAVVVNLASDFVSNGMSTFRFDFAGSGESEGGFRYGNYWEDAEDLRCVICYLRSFGSKVNVLVGHSKGGNAVLLYASKYKDVSIVVNISGRFHLERGISKRLGTNYSEVMERQGYVDVKDRSGNLIYRVTKHSLKERLSTNMEKALISISEQCRVLTAHGSKDETVSVEEANDFDRLIKNHKLVILEDADHYFRQHQRVLATVVLNFVMSSLTECKCEKTQLSERTYTLASRL